MLNWRKDSPKREAGDEPDENAATPASADDEPDPNPATTESGLQHPRSQLGAILVEEGVITQAQLDEALAKKEQDGGFLGQALVDLKYIHRETLISFLVKQCKIPHLSLLDYQFNEDLFKYISKETCLRYSLLPIDRLGKILTVAMVDPLDIEALEAVRTACPELRIKPILCDWYHYETIARRVLESNTDTKEETASSFGLSERSPKAKPANAPANKPAAPTRPTPPQTKPAAQAASKPKPAVQTPPPEPTTDTSDPPAASEDMAAIARKTAYETVQEASANIADLVRDSIAKAAAPDDLAAAVGESVRGAMRDVIAALEKHAQTPPSGKSPASGPELAAMMREGIREAIRELTPALTAGAGNPNLSGLTAYQEARDALAQQEARLLEVTEAAAQAAKAAEAAALEKAQQRGKWEAARKQKHASVAPLNKSEQDALEAIEGPGLHAQADDRVHAALASEQPLAAYTFDTYFISKANSFTVAMAKAVSDTPGGEYNPFFLYGDVGIGKTHLINAIGNHILQKAPDQRVGYVSSSRFASALIDAIQEHALDVFRDNYCHWDVLILDDIQFMGGRVEAQEEFFHIFNALHQEGRQIIIAGDKPPDQLGALEKRLVSRFAGGIVASLRPPEWETRMAILRHQVKDSKVQVPEEVLSLIATRVPNDVRKMSGALRKVAAFAGLVGQEVTCDLATEILSHLGLDNAA